MRFYSRAFLVFPMKESKKRRRKQPGKLMAKSHSQPVNLPSACEPPGKYCFVYRYKRRAYEGQFMV